MVVEEPTWFELDREDNLNAFRDNLDQYIAHFGKSPIIVCIVLKNENLYNNYKNICYERNTVS